MANKNVLIVVLVAVIVVLAAIMAYAFLIRPAFTGYTVEKQNEGVQIAVNYIVGQLQQQGFVQIPIGNQTLILVPYNPPAAQTTGQPTSG
ncbi:MAG: hypothetical protein Q8P79_02770 [Nanoarchaeota archaeon]|nr:hypothetical protein [Nanoarchaeota archaeon]